MSDFRWIALALTVTAACQVYDRVPWRRGWGWLTAKALALRSWVFREEDAPVSGWDWVNYDEPAVEYTAPVIAADDVDWIEFAATDPTPEGVPELCGGNLARLRDAKKEKPAPRRRPSRASAAKARKAKK